MSQEQDHLIFTKGQRIGEKVYLATLPVVLGRMAPADLIVANEKVSRQHARINRDPAGYTIEDLNSSNGTFINGVRIQGARRLADGDLVRLGPEVEFGLVAPPPVPPPAPSVDQTIAAAVRPPQAGQSQARETVNLAGQSQPRETVNLAGQSQAGAALNPAGPGQAHETMNLAPSPGPTVKLSDMAPAPALPPKLVVSVPGQPPVVYELTGERLRIGRHVENEIVIDNRFVSRYHAELEKRGGDYYLIPSPNYNNSLLLNSQPVMEAARLRHGDKVRIGGYAPGDVASLDYLLPFGDQFAQTIRFVENNVMTIGRDAGNKIVLPSPTVSRFHAEVEKVGQRYRVRDLRSSNGTFVNGKRVDGQTWVHAGETIQIGQYRFAVDENEFTRTDETSQGVMVEVLGLNKWVNKKLNILQDISLVFKPREFIVVVGQSGGGKSTLVDAIAGYRPATHGKVMVNRTIDVYKEFDAIRSTIGYVPQKDIIHMELTVFQALDYAAQLRMPSDTSRAERIQRVEEVMADLDLSHRRDTQISQLSGGQQKRVSIGVELLTKPGLFFLDEPTSGLDPGMETELMHLMRRLADQGRTIVMITHATKNVMLADKVVFLARGGYLTWFGPPEEALSYFDQYRSERDRRASPMEFDHIYTLLDTPELGTGADWAERFRRWPAYQNYIAEPLKERTGAVKGADQQNTGRSIASRKQVSRLRQFSILSRRNLTITTRDRFSLALLVLTAPLMAMLDFVLAFGVGRSPTAFSNGNFNNVLITLIVLTNTSILVGGLSFIRELVKEREIYKRERMVNQHLSSYMMSKVWIALLLAVYQAAVFTVVRYMAFEMPGGAQGLVLFYITEFLLVVAGMMMGLFASAAAPNSNSAPLLLILFIIPQMVLSGALVPLPNAVKAVASSRWAFQAVMAISGVGSSPAGDSCWDLTQEERDALTLDEKNSQCTCMGENALRQESCNFPGLGKYYTAAIDEKDPVKPVEPGPQPAEPVLPAAPSKPADPNNILLLQKYLVDLDDYNQEVTSLQDDYKASIDDWQQQQEDYKTQLETYQQDLTELEVERAIAVGSAESTIRHYKEDYGWTFVNKNDRPVYYRTLVITWAAQLIIILVLFTGTVLLQKRLDVV